MNIFIDTISFPSVFILFDKNRKIVDQYSWEMQGNESSMMLPKIEELLDKNQCVFGNLENIVIVNGPGSFTGVRTSVLVANTMNFILKKHMTSLSYFELFENYPIIKNSSKRDCFVQKKQGAIIEIIENNNLHDYLKEKNITQVYGSTQFEWSQDVEIIDKIDYIHIIDSLEFQKLPKVEPLYIKKPNIS